MSLNSLEADKNVEIGLTNVGLILMVGLQIDLLGLVAETWGDI